jgi:hypothetical protein
MTLLRIAEIEVDARVWPHLIVDDVLTTGASMEAARAKLWPGSLPLGVVIFARGPCPDWVWPIFRLDPTFGP